MSIDITLNDNKKSKFWSLLKAGKNTIKDSTGLAVYVVYSLLNQNGIAGLVTERGILNNGSENNSWQKKLRKFLIENTSIKEILLLPKGIFSYTNFDTACIIFEKGNKTEQIIFHQGYFKEEDKGKSDKQMYITENILTITLEDIINKDWSLNSDNYIDKVENLYNGIEYKKLGDICEFKAGKPLTINKMLGGDYQVIGGGTNLMNNYYHEYNTEPNQILMSNIGSAGFINRFNKKLFITNNCSKCKILNNNILESYLYYYLKSIQNKLMIKEELGGFQKGQGQPFINIYKMYKKVKVPILQQDHQEDIVEYLENKFNNNISKLDKIISLFKDYDIFKILINKNYSGFNELIDLYEDIIWADQHYKRMIEPYKTSLIKKCFKMFKSEEKN